MPRKRNNQRRPRSRGGKSQSKQAGNAMNRLMASSGGPAKTFGATHIFGAPQTQRVTLAWTGSGNVGNAAGGFAYQALQVNNPYAPDNTFFSASAQAYAKWIAFYSKCFVIRIRFKTSFLAVTASNATIPATVPQVVGCTFTTNSTSLGSFQQAINNGLSQWKLLGAYPDATTFTGTLDVAKFLNKPNILDDEDLLCTSSAGPSQVICLHIWGANPSTFQNITTINWCNVIELEMDCIFTDPNPFT